MQKCYFLMIGTLGAGNGYLFGNLFGHRLRQLSFGNCSDNAVLSPYQTQNLDRHHLDLGSYNRILASNFQLSFHLFILSFIHLFFYSSIHSFILSLLHSLLHSSILSSIYYCFIHSFINSFILSNSLMLLE